MPTENPAARAPTAARLRPLLAATLLATLITTTISLTARSSDAFTTLGLHYPLFLLISLILAMCLPRRWQTVLSLSTIPLIAAELVALRLL